MGEQLNKREQYAVAAMQVLMADGKLSTYAVAERAVKQADALMDALNKGCNDAK